MKPKKRTKKLFAWVLTFMLVLGVMAPLATEEVSAAETSLSSKQWTASMENVLKTKLGNAYEASDTYMCTGFVAWAINHPDIYNVPSWPNNGVVRDFRSRLINTHGVTEVSVANARPGDIVTFGDSHIAIVGNDMKLWHNIYRGVVHQYTIQEYEAMEFKSGEARVFRGFQQEITVNVTVNKTSANPEYTNGNPNYSLKGAKYGIYKGSVSDANLLKTITTDANGKASGSISVKPDIAKTLVIKEIDPSPGYINDPTTYRKDGSSGSITVNSKEAPKGDPIRVLLYKSDAETGKNLDADELKTYYPQKAGSLAGAVFKITHYKMSEADMPKDKNYSNVNAESRTWYVKTNENGYALLEDKYLAAGYEQSEYYIDPATNEITFPLGVITVQEVEAPKGYLVNDEVFATYIAADGTNQFVDRLEEPIVPDQIKRSDLQFNKAKEDSFDRLANVPFMLTCIEQDGKTVPENERESHIVVTDANGIVDTSKVKHSNKTNANDAAWNGSEINESNLDPEAGVWFGPMSAVKDSKGALPYGTYILEELPCEANEGLTLIKDVKFIITQDNYVVPIGTLTDKQIELDSQAWDAQWSSTKTQITMARENLTIKDRVEYDGVVADEEYTLKGVIIDKETGEPLKVNGKKIESEKKFTAEGAKGNVENEFTFDASKLAGKEIVVYEYLLHGNEIIASHEALDDEDQTITFLNVTAETTAIDSETGTNYSIADEEVTITDTVEFANLLDGQQYVLTGTLMNKETKEPLLVNGKKVTEKIEFFSNTGKGKKEMTFTFDATGLEGKDIVVFQEITWDDNVVGGHKDFNSESQTIHFPGIKTSAEDSDTNLRIANADREVTVVDTVTYWNVMPQQNYKLKGKLVDGETEEVIAEATGTFTAAESEGEAEVTFTFDGRDLAGRNVVIFEELYFDGVFNNQKIAKHIDITDEKQTVHFPEIGTTAVDVTTNSHLARAGATAFLKDTVKYSNVLAEKEYTVTGVLMDKDTGEPILDETGKQITASETFTAEETSGSVEVNFTFPAQAFEGKTVVVFEKLFVNDKEIASHEDINDEEQAIHFPKVRTTLTDTVTENHIALAGDSKFVDVVKYENVIPGYKYELVGFLMDAEKEEPILVDGKEVTATAKFTADKANGEEEVVFKFDSSSLEGKKVVAYEALLYNSYIVGAHTDIADFNQSVTLPKIRTTALDSETNMHISYADDKVTIIDTVSYEGLLADEEYEMKGYLMNKTTGKNVLVDGEPIVATTTFTAEEPKGTVEVKFEFDAKNIAGQQFVAFEELYFGGHLVGEHKDIADEKQTVYLPKIKTTAVDVITNAHVAKPDASVSIKDTVEYTSVLPEEEYTVTGVLMDKDTGEPILDAAGNQITASKTFTAKETNGSVEVDFTLPAEDFAGKTVVVFEKLFIGNHVIASHEDITDEEQAVHFPKIKTTLNDTVTQNHIGLAGNSRLVDTVKFENVVPGYEYELIGLLMDAEKEEPVMVDGKEVTATAKFTPDKANGEEEVVFTFDSSSLKGKKVVAYEELLYNSFTIASHSDIEDFNQSVTIPKIGTTAVDSETNMHISYADNKVTIIDTVSYEGLLAGEEYEMKGALMDKATGINIFSDNKPVIATTKFTAEEPNGEVEVVFTLDAKDYAGHTAVAFEELYFEGYIVGEHKDIENPEQSILFPKLKTKAVERESGKHKLTFEAGKKITIVDTVSYSNLIEGETYTVSGILMDKATGKALLDNGKEVTAEKEFVAEKASGEVEMEFTVSMEAVKDKSAVVFEKLYIHTPSNENVTDEDTDGEIIIVGSHEDLNDKDQTVSIITAVKTGDSTPVIVLVATFFMTLAAAAAVFVARRRYA